jgi:DNA-directed RNA polymerase specialized sigma24 family protein
MNPGSITRHILNLQQGKCESLARAELSRRFLGRLASAVRRRAGDFRGKDGFDAEDAANEALFDAFTRLESEGPSQRLRCRDDLLALLLRMALNKAYNAIRDEHRQKRGGGKVGPLTDVAAAGIPPDALVAGEEYVRRLTDGLPPQLEKVLAGLMEGLSNQEIAERLGGTARSLTNHYRKKLQEYVVSRLDPEDREWLGAAGQE